MTATRADRPRDVLGDWGGIPVVLDESLPRGWIVLRAEPPSLTAREDAWTAAWLAYLDERRAR